MAEEKQIDERAKVLSERRRQLSREELAFEIDESTLAIKRLRTSADPDVSVAGFGQIKRIWSNGLGQVSFEDVGLDWGKTKKYTWTKKNIFWLEEKLAFLLVMKYSGASPGEKKKVVDEIPSNLKGHYLLSPILLAHYNASSTEDKKKQIDEIFNEVLSKLTLKKNQENNLLTPTVEKLKTDITTFKDVLKAEVDTPQKNGWCEPPNPMKTALYLHDAVYQLSDKEINK